MLNSDEKEEKFVLDSSRHSLACSVFSSSLDVVSVGTASMGVLSLSWVNYGDKTTWSMNKSGESGWEASKQRSPVLSFSITNALTQICYLTTSENALEFPLRHEKFTPNLTSFRSNNSEIDAISLASPFESIGLCRRGKNCLRFSLVRLNFLSQWICFSSSHFTFFCRLRARHCCVCWKIYRRSSVSSSTAEKEERNEILKRALCCTEKNSNEWFLRRRGALERRSEVFISAHSRFLDEEIRPFSLALTIVECEIMKYLWFCRKIQWTGNLYFFLIGIHDSLVVQFACIVCSLSPSLSFELHS